MIHPRHTARTRLVNVAIALSLLLGPTFMTACEEEVFVPPDPPDEIEEINNVNAYLFRNWDTTEDNVLEPGLEQLIDLLAEIDLDTDYKERCFVPDALTLEDIEGIDHPDRDPEDVLAVALVMASDFLPAAQAEVIILPDQRPVEPASPDLYDRTFLDPTNPSCFPSADCDRLDTTNHILKDYLALNMEYDMPKYFRWVEIGAVGSGEWAILGRAWIEQEYETDGGAIQLNQSYSLDVFFPRDGGGARYMSLWPETFIDGIDDEFIYETTAMGMDQMFEATEEYVAAM